ncbi:early nodulin-like protein 1 [Carya illinoinensis]|uniref:Phytocyanin domain-containing protein n=1 Tax=Carya illinoinensis TaxID=32201 RepID=A0A8T1N6R1_CARIL|nr:early nodulin-like protein 1 [Carya illinoinensis]KAG6627399.1 hypothetical protein CIPAW_15G124900 [Carya illinoinensis]
MASLTFTFSSKLFLFMILCLSSNQFSFVAPSQFEVGGDHGWVVPKSKNDQLYNQWASENRFKVDDTVYFKYKKDSVLVVSEEEYEKCHSAHPLFFSNNGDSVFKLDRPGLFYFISGVSGHCERGQKMIIKVLEPAHPPDQSANDNTTTDVPTQNNAAAVVFDQNMNAISSPIILSSMVSFFGLLFV